MKPIDIILVTALLLIVGCSGTRPLHVNNQTELAACPDTPNCVNTRSTDEVHSIDSFQYKGDAAGMMERLAAVIGSMDRTEIITQTESYLYVEFTSKMWKYVDDVEFLFDSETNTIHFRSASRLGKSDFGVNRERMETIRGLLSDHLK